MKKVILVIGFLSFSFLAISQSLFDQAISLLQKEQYAEAVVLFEKVILGVEISDGETLRLAKNNGALAAYYLGSKLKNEAKFKESVLQFEKGIEWNPGFFGNHIARAESIEKLGKRKDTFEAYLYAAKGCMDALKMDYALEMIDKAEGVSKKSEKSEILFNQGLYFEALGDYPAAIDYFEKIQKPRKLKKLALQKIEILDRA
jgi:tetratricopeptide (TPR) repeat protein